MPPAPLPTAVVAVKSVPVGGAFLRVEDGRLTREGVTHGLDPVNEQTVEWALRAREAGSLDRVSVVAMGPSDAAVAVRRALAMGCDEAVLVSDPSLAGASVGTTARVVAAVARFLGAGIVVCGSESFDGSSGVVPSAIAAVLERPLLSAVRDATVLDGWVEAERDVGEGAERLRAPLPAVLSFVTVGGAPRFPKVKDMLRAQRAPVRQLGVATLGVESVEEPVERAVRLVPVPSVPREQQVMEADAGPEAICAVLESAGALPPK